MAPKSQHTPGPDQRPTFACPTCTQRTWALVPTICRDVDGPFRTGVCGVCHDSFNRERALMARLAQLDAGAI